MEPLTTWYFRMFAKAVVLLSRPSRVDWGSLAKAAFVGAKMVYSPILKINDIYFLHLNENKTLACHKIGYLKNISV